MLSFGVPMNTRNPNRKGLRFLLIALVLVQWLHGVPGFAASRGDRPNLPSGFLFDNLPIFSDFDGDNKVDQATLSSSGGFKNIHVALGKSFWSSLSFDSNDGDRGRLVSGDIDEDGDIDLVWVSQNAGKFIAWLGDGQGHFSIGTDVRLSFERIQALLGNGAPRLGDGANAAELTAVLLSTSFIVPGINGYHPYLSGQGSLLAIDTLDICAACFSVFKQRGPPSKLF